MTQSEEQACRELKLPRQEMGDAKVPVKPFPYYPSPIPEAEMKRMEVMMELNKWANNDPFVAKRTAETLILLLADQFDINLVQLNP